MEAPSCYLGDGLATQFAAKTDQRSACDGHGQTTATLSGKSLSHRAREGAAKPRKGEGEWG